MPLADNLGLLLGSLAKQGQGLFSDAAGFAMHGPAAYQEEQENARQASSQAAETARQQAALAQALNLHNTLTPYETGELALSSRTADRADKQNTLGSQMDIFNAIKGGATLATPGTPGALPIGDQFLLPGDKNSYSIKKDSDVGKYLGIDADMDQLPAQEYLQYHNDWATHHAAQEQKLATAETIEAQKKEMAAQIDKRFSPEYYASTYGPGQMDPGAKMWSDMLHSQLETSAATDKKQGNTTQVDAFARQLREYQSQWEKLHNELRLAGARSSAEAKATLDAKYPDPTDAEVKQWTDALAQRGTPILQSAKSLNPKLAIAVEQEAGKRGINILQLTNNEKDNRDLAGIGMNRIDRIQKLISQPGMDKSFGPAASRWQDFQANKIGSMSDARWKQVQNDMTYLKGLIGKIHYTARGAANVHIQEILSSLFDPTKMDLPTLQRGMADSREILSLYANEGGGSNTPQDQLGLTPPTKAPLTFDTVGGK